jgi:3-hydroxyisobutyrate dehydrogenase
MRIGFIGLGIMGASMAANLQKAGYKLTVHDLRRAAADPHIAAGAIWADSPKRVAENSDVVFTSLPVPADVQNVALGDNGIIAGLKPDGAYFDLSTNAVSVVRELNVAFAKRGSHMLDAPVSGGPRGAASGRLAIWVGGNEEIFNRYKPILESIGDQVIYIGETGAGTIAKLVHNATSATMNIVLAEIFAMGIKAGVEPLALWEAVRQGNSGRRRTFDGLTDHYLTGEYDPPDFAFRLIHKDVSLAAQLGREVGAPMRMVNLALQEMTEALNRGWGNRDSRVAMLLAQERAGIPEIKVDKQRIQAVLQRDNKS